MAIQKASEHFFSKKKIKLLAFENKDLHLY